MGAISKWDSPVFTEAFLIWTAHGRDFIPRRNSAAVVTRFGTKAASELLPAMQSMIDEFYQSEALYIATNPKELGDMAIKEFKAKHSEVADEVLEAMAWCYTFDNK